MLGVQWRGPCWRGIRSVVGDHHVQALPASFRGRQVAPCQGWGGGEGAAVPAKTDALPGCVCVGGGEGLVTAVGWVFI